MKQIPFFKYTSYGNNFVIVDETTNERLSEEEKARFASRAADPYFGIGCDNLIVMQRCTPVVLDDINATRGYWKTEPEASADFVFRMFEPSGDEAFSCGNGLMSLASHVNERFGMESCTIMTEIPMPTPHIIRIGADNRNETAWANMGAARRVPASVTSESIRRSVTSEIDVVDNINIRFRTHDLKPYTEETSLRMAGYLVFTGEPHLVVFPDESFDVPELAAPMFDNLGVGGTVPDMGHRISIGTWLVRHIGSFFNDHFRDHFPAGINVSFARVDEGRGFVEYRCFERGINRETLACGTGAVAASIIARHLYGLQSWPITVLPHVCRWHDQDAKIEVSCNENGEWHLNGATRRVFEGSFACPKEGDHFTGLQHADADTQDLVRMEGRTFLPALHPAG